MAKIKVYEISGAEAGNLTLNDEVFGAEYNEALIHQVVVAQLANRRQGTQCALTRAEVRGHAKKPWRQKGTGRARQGSTKGPQWRGGGMVFAVKPRDYTQKINKQMKRKAFISAISAKLAQNDIVVVKDFALSAPKTKEMQKVLDNLKLSQRTLFVGKNIDEAIKRASNNIQKLSYTESELVSVYDVVANAKLLVTESAIKAIEEGYKA